MRLQDLQGWGCNNSNKHLFTTRQKFKDSFWRCSFMTRSLKRRTRMVNILVCKDKARECFKLSVGLKTQAPTLSPPTHTIWESNLYPWTCLSIRTGHRNTDIASFKIFVVLHNKEMQGLRLRWKFLCVKFKIKPIFLG